MIDSMGGYRLLRSLGSGPRAEVFLAHPVEPVEGHPPVVMKVYGPSVTDESVFTEIEALTRAAGDHVVGVVDVASTPEGSPTLVLTRHAAGGVARLLTDRDGLALGEVVTVLAPLAAALRRMHSAGVAHGGLGAGSVLFDASGSPTLACFGRATLHEPGLPIARLEAEQAVLDDVLAYGTLAGALLERAGAGQAAHRARTEAAPDGWLTAFADSLFDLADPLPVGLARRDIPRSELPGRVIAPRSPEPTARGRHRARASDPPARGGIVKRVRGETREPSGRPARLLASVRAVRRPVWMVGAAGVAATGVMALVVAFAGVPPGEPGEPGEPDSVRGSTAARPGSPASGPVTGDDPAAAALVLLEARELCIRDLDIACLEGVTQVGSSAREADETLIRSITAGETAGSLPEPTAAEVVQRLGDSALVALSPDSEPASLLLVRGEAGWRIRDYLDE